MKKANQYLDPVNYKLSKDDPLSGEDFSSFLHELTDVPSSQPLQNISINEAGITSQQVIVQIDDIDKKGFKVPVVCDVTLKVDLQGHRGIHMSRCEQVLFDACDKTYGNLDDFSLAIAEGIREKQQSEKSFVRMTGTYLHRRLTRKSKKESQDRIYLISNVEMGKDITKIETGVKAYNMTACPCTRTFTKYSIVPALTKLGYSIDQIQEILDITHSGTHTQRGVVTLLMDKNSNEITHGALYGVLEESCHLIYELLKRPDEHDLVVRALSKPQFTEDVVREVAQVAFEKFKDQVGGDTSMTVESVLLDSIHIHDVCTLIHKNFSEIENELRK